MKKIAIYGVGNRCGIWHKWLMEDYTVVCFVPDTEVQSPIIKGVPVIDKTKLSDFSYDAMLILTDRKADDVINSISPYVSKGISIYWLDSFLEEEGKKGYYEALCVKKQIEILHEVLDATDDEICSFKWLYEKVIRYGLYCFRSLWREWSDEINWTVCGMQQIPEEFTNYCIYLSGLEISSAIDIGVYKGRSSYFICAILMRRNPNLSYELVDIEDRLDHFEEYCKVLPAIKRSIPSTSSDYIGQNFDYVFIDADHTYDGSMADYENVGKNAKVIVAFHDIYAHEYDNYNGGTVRMWKEVCQKEAGNQIVTFSKYPGVWMGIGCVKKTNTDIICE